MASVNKVFVMGHLGQDPELRYTPNQQAVATINVATSEFRTNKDGVRQEQTGWHRFVVWGKQAENCHKFLKKGRAVFVEGRLQTRSWDDKSGQKRYTTEIIANNVQFLSAGGAGAYNNQGGSEYGQLGSDPFAGDMGGQDGMNLAGSPSFPRADRSENRHTNFDADLPSLDEIPF